MQLNTIFDQYIGLKDAFVEGNAMKVKQYAQKVHLDLANADMKLLTGDAHMQWMSIQENLDSQLKQMSANGDIEEQRESFSAFSKEFYKALKIFGLMGKTVYYQFCPMAFDGNGAFWLSTTKEIRNPYFGDQMLTCGELKETLDY